MTNLARSVNADTRSIKDRLNAIRLRMAQSAPRAGRHPDDVTLIGVAKTVPLERIRSAVEAGLADLGENRVQETEAIAAALGLGVRWHMIGNLQRNKAGRAAELFDRIHTIDREETAAAIARRAGAAGRVVQVLVQVNVSGELQKHGVNPADASRLIERVARLAGLKLDGVMSIGAAVERAEDARRQFAKTREVRDRAQRETGLALPHLSMGMSGDFEIAIEEGSTMVRVGTALFGERG